MKMKSILQKVLLALGVIALFFLVLEISIALSATQHGSTPARVDAITSGPYHFTVSLYTDPARAGFALPFAIVPQEPVKGTWTYSVTSIPQGEHLKNGTTRMQGNLIATPIKDSVSPDPHRVGGVQGAAEITVQGLWDLHVVVDGPRGQQTFDVAVTATTLPPFPAWLGWQFGFIPVYGSIVFLFVQIIGRKRQREQSAPQIG